MVFPVVMYGHESWTVKKAECRRIDAFDLRCLRRRLRVSWTAGRSNQTILKKISPECSLEGLMLKLKRQYFGHLMGEVTHLKRPWCWGRLRQGEKGMTKDEMVGGHHRFNGDEFEYTLGVGDGQEGLACCSSWGRKELDTTERRTELNWNKVTTLQSCYFLDVHEG